jgi:AsmA protein
LPARSTDPPTETSAQPRRKQRLLWTFLVLSLLLLLALTPPLLNVNRLRRRITASMSASLGRPVHLDRVSIHLLPVPGFTLENLVVSEDPAFGFEPTIRANTVEATLRPSSLWRRQVEFSTIRFIEPSLNLVRNAQGRWNLQSLMMHAASVDTAPTEQRKPGPEPRFPYIEATGARVNLKLGPEKKPFSLTDADFALWLPSPQQWRVRIEAKPARTDTNVADPGTIRLEGSLERAATMADVPVDLRASWTGAPLGEASRLLSGEDAGWRGSLTAEATLTGKLGAAKLATKVHLEDLRRADFVPPKSLDLALECSGTLEMMTAVLHSPACILPAEKLSAAADSLDLTTLTAQGLQIGSPGISEDWPVDWVRLFTQRPPIKPGSGGVITGSAELVDAGPHLTGTWQGEFDGEIDPFLPSSPPRMAPLGFSVTGEDGDWVLAPVNLLPPGKTLLLSGSANRDGYTLHLEGTATPQEILALRASAPPLGDGLEEAQPELFDPTSTKPLKIDVTCTRKWRGPQTCTAAAPEPPKRPSRRR